MDLSKHIWSYRFEAKPDPNGDPDEPVYGFEVIRNKDFVSDSYLVRSERNNRRYNCYGYSDPEIHNSSKTEQWIREHSFTLKEAIKIALTEVKKIEDKYGS